MLTLRSRPSGARRGPLALGLLTVALAATSVGLPDRAVAALEESPVVSSTMTLNGGYVAAGVGLRNRGSGTISVSGIPAGSTVEQAFLYWSILGVEPQPDYAQGLVNGTSVTGDLIDSGPAPCWPDIPVGFAYRADATSVVSGNGPVTLSGFASGSRAADDPWDAEPSLPLAEGASLVVVYRNPAYPLTSVTIADGYTMVGSGRTATLTMPLGATASNPVGAARTTFIGADGQATSEPASTFNGRAVAEADWDGTDGPTPGYSQGNLWDTMTASVGQWIIPGATTATMTVSGGADCMAWVAQVVSMGVNGATDTDGDSLKDGWEANGLDADGNGSIDVPLPAYGASPFRKDVFVEMDYMGAEASCPCHLPLAADLARIVAVFAGAPAARNPDSSTGIRLHLDAGPARGSAYNLGGGNLVPHDADLNPLVSQFSALKSKHFNSKRAKVFHYMIWAHSYGGSTSSGNAFAIPSDSFVVTLGDWPGHGSSNVKVGTFVHELGHNLGQRHGGDDHVNYEPNYLSVMNYSFQVTGVPKTSGSPYFGFSAFTAPALSESALDQGVGIDTTAAAPYRTRWFCPSGVLTTSPGTADGPIDWNCNGGASGKVSVDANGDGVLGSLDGWDNWSTLTYGGGTVGGGVSPLTGLASQRVPSVPQELTWQEHLRTR